MEESIGYEALLSADEWDSLNLGEWTDGDGFNPEGNCSGNGPSAASPEHESQESETRGSGSPSGVTPSNGDGRAAPSQEVASEGSYQGPEHTVSCTHRVWGNEPSTYLLECDVCEIVGSADTLEEAQAIARLHESFVAELVGRWTVTS